MSETLTTAIEAGMTSAATDVSGIMVVVLPAALGIFLAVWGIGKVKGFFKKAA